MATVQSTYGETMRAGLPGMVANAEDQNVITRTNSGASAIGFGLPVMRDGDHSCVLGSLETLEAASSNGAVAPAGATITANPTVSAGAKIGRYKVTCILGGAGTASKWEVEDPEGIIVGIATGATAFSGGGLAFTIADAGADPVVGEQFYIDVSATEATDDLDVLGVAVRDVSLEPGASDSFAQYASVPIITEGVVWVTAGASVSAGDDVYWNPSTSRYTDDPTHLAMPGWKFDGASTNGSIVKIARR
jgi:hypothetical protein